MKRSAMEERRLLDGVEARENSRTATISFLDEFCTAGPTNDDLTMIALTIFVAPVFLPSPMWIASIMAGINTSAGIVNYRVGLYKAVRPQRAARNRMVTELGGGITYPIINNGNVEWSKIDLGPIVAQEAAGTGRYLWQLAREYIARPPDIYGIAFAADSNNGVFKGGANQIATHTAARCVGARSSLNDFPDILTTTQGGQMPVPCFALRSPRALNWIGG